MKMNSNTTFHIIDTTIHIINTTFHIINTKLHITRCMQQINFENVCVCTTFWIATTDFCRGSQTRGSAEPKSAGPSILRP